jgi:hypothetical protein
VINPSRVLVKLESGILDNTTIYRKRSVKVVKKERGNSAKKEDVLE